MNNYDSDYQMLNSMVNGGGATQVSVPGNMISRVNRTVQVNPYDGDYYTYGQNGGEHQFVDYGGLFEDRRFSPVQSQSYSAPMTLQQQDMSSGRVASSAPVIQAGTAGRDPMVGKTKAAPSTKSTTSANDDVAKLMAALNKKSASPGAPTYLDLLARDPETVMPTSIEARRDPFYGMAGWNQGGN